MMKEIKYNEKITDMYENPDIEDVAGFFTDSVLFEKRQNATLGESGMFLH